MEVDQEWVPYSQDASLYLRPTFIGIEVSFGIDAQTAEMDSTHTVV